METEIWKAHPDIAGVEVSTFGNVRTLDKMVSNEKGTYFKKGRILKQQKNNRGYQRVGFYVNGKNVHKLVHRLVAQTFIKNPDNLPEINHLDCDPANNNVSNLEWCTSEYNIEYREKYGKALSRPVYAVNLATLEVSRYPSQNEAGRELGINSGNVNSVLKGKLKQTHSYWFTEDDGNGIEIDKNKLNNIVAGTLFRSTVFAVDLKTQEVSQFCSQSEAGRELGIKQQNINAVIKGRLKQAGGYWFVNDDGHAVDVVKNKLHDIGKTGLKI